MYNYEKVNDCAYVSSSTNFHRVQIWYISLFAEQCQSGEIWLDPAEKALTAADLYKYGRGYLRTCIGNVWESPCSDGMDNKVATVACRQLGHPLQGRL